VIANYQKFGLPSQMHGATLLLLSGIAALRSRKMIFEPFKCVRLHIVGKIRWVPSMIAISQAGFKTLLSVLKFAPFDVRAQTKLLSALAQGPRPAYIGAWMFRA
jgi:hypothetical protein